jgi:hypothetical protein
MHIQELGNNIQNYYQETWRRDHYEDLSIGTRIIQSVPRKTSPTH